MGHSHNLNKLKPKSNSVKSVSDIWNSFTIFWAPSKSLENHSQHIQLVLQAQVGCIPCLLGSQVVVQCYWHLQKVGVSTTARLHLHQQPHLASHGVKPQLLFKTPIKFGCQQERQPQLPVEHRFCGLTLRKHFPKDVKGPRKSTVSFQQFLSLLILQLQQMRQKM